MKLIIKPGKFDLKIKSVIISAFFWMLITSCQEQSGMEFKIRQDLKSCFQTMDYKAQVYGNVAYNDPRLLELQKIMTDAVKQKPAWFKEHKQMYGQPVPYHPNLGLSKEEYNELLQLYSQNKPELQLSSVEDVEVIVKKNKVRFNGKNDLQFMDNLEIDIRENIIRMNGHTLEFLGEESTDNADNIFKTAYTAYSYQFLEPGNAVKIPSGDYKKQDVSIYKVTVGKLERGNRTFMIVKGLEFDKGQKTFDFEAPVIF
jgi:hypothetical protein